MPPLRVEAITDFEGFRSLEPIWNPLLERTDTAVPFLTHEWLTTWWASFGCGADPFVLVVRRGDEPVALAPLRVSRDDRRLSFMANAYSMRANFLLADEPEASLRAIFAHLAGSGLQWDEMLFNYMPGESAATRLSAAVCSECGLRFGFRPSLMSPHLSLAGLDWDEYLKGLGAGFRKNLLQSERRLSREGGHAAIYAEPNSLEEALDACRQVALTTWQHEQGTSIASAPQLWEFYRSFARVAAKRGWLRIGLLKAQDQPIAFQYNVCYGHTMYDLKPGYNQEFRRYSPGHVLTAFMIRRAFKEGATDYDMLGMDEPYKMEWTDQVRPHTCLCVAGPGVAAALGYWLEFGARPRLRQWRPARAVKQWLDARRPSATLRGRLRMAPKGRSGAGAPTCQVTRQGKAHSR